MNRFIKLLTGLATCILLSFILSISICAANIFTISLGNVESQPGEIVVVPISMVNAPNFFVSTIEIEYDENAMTLLGVQDTGLANGDEHSDKYGSPYTLTWVNNGASISDGVVAELTFKLSNDVEDDLHIRINIPRDGVIDNDGKILEPQTYGGIIYIVEDHEHDYGRWSKYNSVKHMRECDCGEVEYERHDWDDGEVTEEPTEDSTGVLTYTCDTCGATKTEIIPALEPDEYDISGTVTSYGDADEVVTVILYDADGSMIDSDTTTDGTYTLSAPDGTYTLRVSKANHVTRDYIVEVSGGAVTQNVKIHPLGDVNGDGVVNGNDIQRIYAHITGSSPITDSAMLKRANVNGDSVINGNDIQRIYAHITGANLLF